MKYEMRSNDTPHLPPRGNCILVNRSEQPTTARLSRHAHTLSAGISRTLQAQAARFVMG